MYLIIKHFQLGNTFVNSTVFVAAELIMNPHSLMLLTDINPIYDTIAIYSLFIRIWEGREVQSVEK